MSRKESKSIVVAAYVALSMGAVVVLGLLALGNVIWQHWYCGSPITECRAFAAIPCEPISGLEAQRSEYTRLAKEYDSAKVGQ